LFVLRLLIVAIQVARAEAPATVFLEEVTSPELCDLIRCGKTTIIDPVGGTDRTTRTCNQMAKPPMG
jgi:creatinine amidohydrolase